MRCRSKHRIAGVCKTSAFLRQKVPESHIVTAYDELHMYLFTFRVCECGSSRRCSVVYLACLSPVHCVVHDDLVILETGQASVSMLQRRLKLGYARAARIVDEMEEKGIVGPFQGSKPRAILITKEQWAARNSGGDQMELDDFIDYGVPEEI